MNLDYYQNQAKEYATYPRIDGKGYIYPALGLSGEAGEVCEKIKRIFRDDAGVFSTVRRDSLRLELGDVLWYISQLATEFGFELSDIALANLEKLQKRKLNGTLSGDGDLR
jgi:NTP pyrophosphatase (non-canonical NTP hydrolase)